MTACREYRGGRTGKGYGVLHGQLLHRWIVEQVEGRPLEAGEVVMHTCDNPPCFLYEHLRRATQSDNIKDAVVKGRHRFRAHRGEANGGGGKLTAAQVAEIRERYVPGRAGNFRELMAEFGVGQTMIHRIVRGDAWQ